MVAVFSVSIGYGVVMPLLPYLIERLLNPANGSPLVGKRPVTAACLGAGLVVILLAWAVWRPLDRSGHDSGVVESGR